MYQGQPLRLDGRTSSAGFHEERAVRNCRCGLRRHGLERDCGHGLGTPGFGATVLDFTSSDITPHSPHPSIPFPKTNKRTSPDPIRTTTTSRQTDEDGPQYISCACVRACITRLYKNVDTHTQIASELCGVMRERYVQNGQTDGNQMTERSIRDTHTYILYRRLGFRIIERFLSLLTTLSSCSLV